MAQATHYQKPGWLTRNVLNRMIARLTRMGVSVAGSRVLRVRGRTSGQMRSNPVNVLTLDGERYLVAPRGVTDWVRNLRIAGTGELVVGRRVESFTATELVRVDGEAGAQELALHVLREYLRRWKWEVGQFFGGVGPESTDEELLAIADKHPIFAVSTVTR